MARLFTCDDCGTSFPEPLDQEMVKDEHGVWHTIDLCAPCLKKRKENKEKIDKDFIKAMLKKGKGK